MCAIANGALRIHLHRRARVPDDLVACVRLILPDRPAHPLDANVAGVVGELERGASPRVERLPAEQVGPRPCIHYVREPALRRVRCWAFVAAVLLAEVLAVRRPWRSVPELGAEVEVDAGLMGLRLRRAGLESDDDEQGARHHVAWGRHRTHGTSRREAVKPHDGDVATKLSASTRAGAHFTWTSARCDMRSSSW